MVIIIILQNFKKLLDIDSETHIYFSKKLHNNSFFLNDKNDVIHTNFKFGIHQGD